MSSANFLMWICFINDSIGNYDEAIKLFTEAILKNPSASMYAKRARYLTDIFVLFCCYGLFSYWPYFPPWLHCMYWSTNAKLVPIVISSWINDD